MTVGYWSEEAQRTVRAATAAMSGRRAGTAGEINALVGARADLYRQLARVTELLIGGRPAVEVPNRAAVALILGRQGQSLTRFYLGLRAAAVDEQYPPAASVTADSARALRRAADSVGVMGDIIASHVPAGLRPGTPEGMAIRAGGGVQAALGDIARLALDAVRLDGMLPAWLDRGGPLGQTYRPVVEAAQWTSTSRLAAAARELVAAAKAQPGLLDELDVARSPLRPAPAVDTLETAIAAVRAARTWLWQHPDQVTGAHLQVGTQLGLAVHVLTTDGNPEMTGGWRQAAIAAADLRATPPTGLARDAAAELSETLRWTRMLLNPGARDHIPQHVGDLARLGTELPLLAATLHRGLSSALQRRDLFIRGEAVLQRPVGSLVYRAARRWRAPTVHDDLVRDLSRALSQRRPNADGRAASVAAKAFPAPTRLGAPAADSRSRPASQPSPSRTPGRSR